MSLESETATQWTQSAPAYRMAVHFFDREILKGSADRFSLDYPEFILKPEPQDNNLTARVPLSSVKMVSLASRPFACDRDEPGTGVQRVALHFSNGEVKCGLLDRPPQVGRYGLLLRFRLEGSIEADGWALLGIPFTSLKAIFYTKQFSTEPKPALASD